MGGWFTEQISTSAFKNQYQLNLRSQRDRRLTPRHQNWESWIRTKTGRSEREKYNPKHSDRAVWARPPLPLSHHLSVEHVFILSTILSTLSPHLLNPSFHHVPPFSLWTLTHVPLYTLLFGIFCIVWNCKVIFYGMATVQFIYFLCFTALFTTITRLQFVVFYTLFHICFYHVPDMLALLVDQIPSICYTYKLGSWDWCCCYNWSHQHCRFLQSSVLHIEMCFWEPQQSVNVASEDHHLQSCERSWIWKNPAQIKFNFLQAESYFCTHSICDL